MCLDGQTEAKLRHFICAPNEMIIWSCVLPSTCLLPLFWKKKTSELSTSGRHCCGRPDGLVMCRQPRQTTWTSPSKRSVCRYATSWFVLRHSIGEKKRNWGGASSDSVIEPYLFFLFVLIFIIWLYRLDGRPIKPLGSTMRVRSQPFVHFFTASGLYCINSFTLTNRKVNDWKKSERCILTSTPPPLRNRKRFRRNNRPKTKKGKEKKNRFRNRSFLCCVSLCWTCPDLIVVLHTWNDDRWQSFQIRSRLDCRSRPTVSDNLYRLSFVLASRYSIIVIIIIIIRFYSIVFSIFFWFCFFSWLIDRFWWWFSTM